MNERIFELAEQAHEETHRVMGSECLQEAFDDFYTEKFAELIVKECADIATYHFRRTFGDGSKAIKEHFGVEE